LSNGLWRGVFLDATGIQGDGSSRPDGSSSVITVCSTTTVLPMQPESPFDKVQVTVQGYILDDSDR